MTRKSYDFLLFPNKLYGKPIMNRKTSNIWQYCTILDRTHAKCGLCKQRLSYKSSITNIKRHLARKHPDVCQYIVGSQYQVAETIEIKPSTSDSEGTYENTFEDGENPQNVNDFGVEEHTEVVSTACGSFHVSTIRVVTLNYSRVIVIFVYVISNMQLFGD